MDFVVADEMILELKSVGTLQPIHEAQLLTYMKLSSCHSGLLINFNVPILRHGLKRLFWPPEKPPHLRSSA